MSLEAIASIETYEYSGAVYNLEVEPNHPSKDDQYYIDNQTGIVIHNCHPRDNIALRWLAKEYDIGYDMFDTIMSAREVQAKNLAYYLIDAYNQYVMEGPIVIHGKAYKPDVEYCIGSYSTLIGHYIKEFGAEVVYIDPLADNRDECVDDAERAVVLMAHNRQITYGYTGEQEKQNFYYNIKPGSVIVDPWRQLESTDTYEVLHYGNTR